MTFPYDIKILHEDDEILVLDKPSGLIVHSDGKTKEPNLVDWILIKHPEIEEVGESWSNDDGSSIPRPGIVHRLDRETSGVIVVAKTDESFVNLKEQFQDRKVEKVYNAFVYGALKADEGEIDRAIGRSSKDFRMWSAQRGARGKMREAVTEFNVLKRGDGVSFLEIHPKTGRTHQIRVHLKAINHPVVCDKLYAPKQDCILGLNRLALHASVISLKNLSGEMLRVEAPLPVDFKKALVSI